MSVILSICIPVYNGGEHLYENVSNILSYQGEELEVIVNDNCSTDGSLDSLMQIEDNRLKIFQKTENEGPFLNWYQALKHGSGKFVMLLRDNDEIIVSNLEPFIRMLEKSSYVAYKNIGDITKDYRGGAVDIAEFFYCSVRLSHPSHAMYLNEEFSKMSPAPESFNGINCAYPFQFWEMQMLLKYPVAEKLCYINTDIPIVRIPVQKRKSRTRDLADSLVKAGLPINFTYEFVLYYGSQRVDFLSKHGLSKHDFMRIVFQMFAAEIKDATIFYYAAMHDEQFSSRYGIPFTNYSPEEWLGFSMRYYNDYIKHLEKYHVPDKREKRILYAIMQINTISFKFQRFMKKSYLNPLFVLECIRKRFLVYWLNRMIKQYGA